MYEEVEVAGYARLKNRIGAGYARMIRLCYEMFGMRCAARSAAPPANNKRRQQAWRRQRLSAQQRVSGDDRRPRAHARLPSAAGTARRCAEAALLPRRRAPRLAAGRDRASPE